MKPKLRDYENEIVMLAFFAGLLMFKLLLPLRSLWILIALLTSAAISAFVEKQLGAQKSQPPERLDPNRALPKLAFAAFVSTSVLVGIGFSYIVLFVFRLI